MILIRTHHKTGTVWMYRIFLDLANVLGLRFCHLPEGIIPNADFYLSSEAPFPSELIKGSFRGLHLIRDPRDVVLSGMHYHLRSDEPWLHVPKPELDGLTYQEKLHASGSDERLYFEMREVGLETTKSMLDWNYNDERFFEARYEDLIQDRDVTLFGEVLNFLGFTGGALRNGINIFRKHSLANSDYSSSDDPHVRSGRPRQWQLEYRRRHGNQFLQIMGDCLVRLGYEQDDKWVESLAD